MSLLSLTRLWFSVSRELGCGWRGFVQTLHHSDQQAAWERGYSAPSYIRLWVWWQRAEKTWCANHFQHLEHREVIKTLSPSALSIHQLAAQGEVSQVAAHLSKGEGSGHKADPTFLSFFFLFFCELKCKKIPAPSSVLQTAHCSANRMNGASLLSCGRQRSERRQWWIFSWRRLEMISGRLGRTSSVIETKCMISLMFIWFFFWFFLFLLGCRPQNNCEGAGERPDTGQLWRLCGHCEISSQTWSWH